MESSTLEDYQRVVRILTRQPSVKDILQSYNKFSDGVIEITLPFGTSVQKAGEILNSAAKEKGMEYPVLYEGDVKLWAKNEANDDLQTKPGRIYQFKVPTDSVSKTKEEQIKEYGPAAPLGAITIAEACERFITENRETLFKNTDGKRLWVRGSAPGVALYSFAGHGVEVYIRNDDDDDHDNDVAFAPSVPAKELKKIKH